MQPLPNSNVPPEVEVVPQDQIEVIHATSGKPTAHSEPANQVSLFERLLSPQSLGWMMTCGGSLLTIGFVVWLCSIGLFENPIAAAASLLVGNMALLGTGIWMRRHTRYKLAGNGLTLLASLLLPLNLWFYDAQGLIVLAEGGPLWIPALCCTIIYAIIARVTRNTMFVYTLVGGIVLTGFLFLAGSVTGLFWSLLSVATLLVAVGTLSIHVDLLFQEPEGPFSREAFGLALFRAGHFVLMGGIAILVACVVPMVPIFSVFGFPLELAGDKVWALALLGTSAYAYTFSHVTRRIERVFAVLACLVLALAVLVVVSLLNITLSVSAIAVAITSAVIFANLVGTGIQYRSVSRVRGLLATTGFLSFASMSVAALAMQTAVWRFIKAAELSTDPMLLIQLKLAWIACLTVPKVWIREGSLLSKVVIVVGATTFSVASVSAMNWLMPMTISMGTIVLLCLVVPIAFLVCASGIASKRFRENASLAAMTVAVTTLLQGLVFAGYGLVAIVSWTSLTATMLATVICFFGAWIGGRREEQVFGSVLLVLTILQVIVLLNLTNAYFLLGAISILACISYIIAWTSDRKSEALVKNVKSEFASRMQVTGHVLASVSAIGSVLFVLSSIITMDVSLGHLALLLSQYLVLGIANWKSTVGAWKTTFRYLAVLLSGTMIVSLVSFSGMSMIHRIEIGFVVVGILLLASALHGWSKEIRPSDTVSAALVLGTLFCVVPMLIGFCSGRFLTGSSEFIRDFWYYFHETGTLAMALALLGIGLLCRIRATTFGGGMLLLTYVGGLIALIQLPEALQSTGVMMMVGGGTFFGVAILLSVYRDRILSLPDRLRNRQGIFRVLEWR